MGEAAMEEREAMEEKTAVARVPLDLVTTQDFIKFWGKFFVFILLVLIENLQGFKTFEFI
jgi:hypothetical protein